MSCDALLVIVEGMRAGDWALERFAVSYAGFAKFVVTFGVEERDLRHRNLTEIVFCINIQPWMLLDECNSHFYRDL